MGNKLDKKFKIFVTIAIVILTLVASASVVLVLTMKPATTQETQEEEVKKENLELVPLGEPINANLEVTANGIPHIVRLTVTFEIDNKAKDYKDCVEQFAIKKEVIRHNIIEVIREQTYENMMKKDAQQILGQQIAERINTVLDTEIIQNVYFGEFFIQ